MTKFGGFRFFHLAHLSVVFTESRSYEVSASCYAPCIPFDKLSAQSTFQELVGIAKSPNHLEMKVDKTSYNEIGSSAHFF